MVNDQYWLGEFYKKEGDCIIKFSIGGGTGSQGRDTMRSKFPDKYTRDKIYNSLIKELHSVVIK